MTRASAYLLLVLVQAACAGVFSYDIIASIFGFYPVPLAWSIRELMEMGAGVGLLLGVVFGTILVFRAFRDLGRAEARLSRASSAFMDMLTARFDEWGLTGA